MSDAFCILTLGCKVNQYESEALREGWRAAGYREVAEPAEAAFALINSCAITENALVDLRATVRRVRREAPLCRVLVTGCAAESLPEAVKAMGVDGIIPQSRKKSLAHGPRGISETAGDAGPAAVHPGVYPDLSISGYSRSRAVLKVQDGCSQHCAYCIVPASRGPSVSRPWPEVLAESSRLLQAGFHEIVVSGINLRQYKHNGDDFWDLMERLESALAPELADLEAARGASGGLRFRISSLEPGQLNDKAMRFLRHSRLVAPHLHLSLQSGSKDVLGRMRRGHYNPESLPDFLAELSAVWPLFALGADIISGFPGESEADFAQTLALARALPLTYAHVFPYSPRPGTPAAGLDGQIAPEVKKERAAVLRLAVQAKKQAFIKEQLALSSCKVIFEEGKSEGLNEYYIDCALEGPERERTRPRALTPVRPLRAEKNKIIVELL